MVLAAGLGTRLRPITFDLAKPLVPVLDRPVMEHALRLLRKHGLQDVVANLHYFPDEIQGYFGDGSRWGMKLDFRFEQELLGTAGGVRNVRSHFGGEAFLIISGDSLTDIDLTAFIEAHRRSGGIATLALKHVANTEEYGVIILDGEGRITGFQEKPAAKDALSDLANCGIYIFEPSIFDHFPERDFADWAQDVFPALLERDLPFHGHVIESYWNDVGSLDEYRQGNFDALEGRVSVEVDASEAEPGLYLGEGVDLKGVEWSAPLYVGPGCRLGDGVTLTGPAIVGARATIGQGAALRDVIVWPGTEIAERSFAIGAIVGKRGAFSA